METDKQEYLKRLPFILRRFSVNDLEKIIFESYIKDWTWENYVDHIRDTEERLTSTSASKYLCQKLKRMPAKELNDLVERILLLDVCLHSTRQQWTTVDMKNGEGMDGTPLSADFADSVRAKLAEQSITSLVHALRRKSHFWISVRLEKASKTSKKSKSIFKRFFVPIFFVIPFNRPIMFVMSNKEKVEKGVLNAVAKAAGYRKASIRQLRDKDIGQMEKMLDMEQSFSEEAYSAAVAKEFEAVPVEHGMDFTTHNHKEDYLNNVALEFPVLQSVSYVTSAPISLAADEGESKEWDNVKFGVRLTFKSKNVWDMVKRMTLEENTFESLPPKYMLKSLFAGKNTNSVELQSEDSDEN
ncbi:uncharacterized protein LOC135938913 [Cloeon dipterum]|uniref:uncharacterized protein LOC135938913 n=1 Tax=Cloeon dipterum TaxID=197152 RepID=UPI0032207599